MLRFLVLALLALAFWYLLEWLYRKMLRALDLEPGRRHRPQQTGSGQRPAGQPPSEVLVRCEACGSYVPTSRALPVGRGTGRLACSEACVQRLRAGTGR